MPDPVDTVDPVDPVDPGDTARPTDGYTPPAVATRLGLVLALADTVPSDLGTVKGWT